jgi:hypothetical protein
MKGSQAKVPFCKNWRYLHGRFPLDCHGFLAQNMRKLHILNVYLHVFQCHHTRSQKVRLIHNVDRYLHPLLRTPREVPFSHFRRTVLTMMLQMLQQLPSKPSMVHDCYCDCCCDRCSSSLPCRPAAVKAFHGVQLQAWQRKTKKGSRAGKLSSLLLCLEVWT